MKSIEIISKEAQEQVRDTVKKYGVNSPKHGIRRIEPTKEGELPEIKEYRLKKVIEKDGRMWVEVD